jgi:RimJ/RimL family protein N-acetyltransferase
LDYGDEAPEEFDVRFATIEDKPRILKLVEKTWDWGDYVPKVLDEWLSQRSGRLFVALRSSELVAIAHLSFERAGLGWMEGARVKEGFRGRGVATMMASEILDYASSIGLRKVRLAVAVGNKPSLRHVAKVGFKAITTFRRLAVKAGISSTPQLEESSVEEVLGSAAYDLYHGMFYKDFRWLDFDREVFEDYSASGRVFGIQGTVVVYSSDRLDDESGRVAEVGYLQPGREAFLEQLKSVFAMKLFDGIELIVPAGLRFEESGKVQRRGEEFVVFEKKL